MKEDQPEKTLEILNQIKQQNQSSIVNSPSPNYWSLYKKTDSPNSIFDTSGDPLKPLQFSNNKTQSDIVQEILDEIQRGTKLIFIHGVCGSGKSAMALNLAKHFKKTSIVVPIKSLQEQYEIDYTKKKFILKESGKPLNISIIKGRNNFRCPFTGEKADSPDLPCTIEIKEKNNTQLLEFIRQNKEIKPEDFSGASDIRRMNIAPACPYWAPIMPTEINPKGLPDVKKIKYKNIEDKEFALFSRQPGCGYYDQYKSYSNSDVLIFNSMKYNIETSIGRKPKTDLDIIDECDEFLDSFSQEKKLNLNRLISSLNNLNPKDQDKRANLKDLIHKLNLLILNPPLTEIEKLDKSPILEILETILENPNLAEDEETSYYNTAVEIARSFENLLDETYISITNITKNKSQQGLFHSSSSDDTILVTLVSINLAQKLQELIDQNNVLVMMSGTLHSKEVLEQIFGLKDFKTIEAESQNPGTINKKFTNAEMNCSYSNFKNGNATRTRYLKVLDMQLARAKKPTLVHISAFADLPTEEEKSRLMLDNVITKERLFEIQNQGNKPIEEFTNKETDILFTTKCSRGIDFAGDKCNSIIVTKFPYPNISGLFWQILKQEQPDKFIKFYIDKARRELIQKVSRGVRFKGDSVDLWSPDIRVLNAKLE
jgi:Rad3-related DNA helicase